MLCFSFKDTAPLYYLRTKRSNVWKSMATNCKFSCEQWYRLFIFCLFMQKLSKKKKKCSVFCSVDHNCNAQQSALPKMHLSSRWGLMSPPVVSNFCPRNSILNWHNLVSAQIWHLIIFLEDGTVHAPKFYRLAKGSLEFHRPFNLAVHNRFNCVC